MAYYGEFNGFIQKPTPAENTNNSEYRKYEDRVNARGQAPAPYSTWLLFVEWKYNDHICPGFVSCAECDEVNVK